MPARREALDRFGEVQAVELAHERDRVAALLAPEAVVQRQLGVHREARAVLRVERAQADEAPADAFQREALADEPDDVGRLPDLRNILVADPHRGSG